VNLSYTALPQNASSDILLDAGRTDVTSLVKTVVGSGSSTPFTFTVSESNTTYQDGEALFVVYKNSSLPTQSVALVDGAASSAGDSTAVNFSSPLNTAASGFTAQLRVADGFSYDQGSVTSQESSITVDGGTLSNNVGNCADGLKIDGSCSNGNLITVGKDPTDTGYLGAAETIQQPNSDLAGNSTDLNQPNMAFNIAPLITNGTSTISLTTYNTSTDDNIFALGFIVSGNAGFNAPPPTVPEPASMAVLATGLLGLRAARRRRG
jgi:hypothetical protein